MVSRGVAGPRILLVEDEVLISVLVESALADLGCQPVGPVDSVAEAVALAGSESLAAAILDVNVRGESVYPVADALKWRRIPFLFITGYRRGELPPPHGDAPMLEKPFDESMLADAIRSLTGVEAC